MYFLLIYVNVLPCFLGLQASRLIDPRFASMMRPVEEEEGIAFLLEIHERIKSLGQLG